MRTGSTSTQSATPPAMVTASGWAPPMPPRPAVSTRRPARSRAVVLLGRRGEGLVGALQDALRADVDPRAGRHLAVHGEAQRVQAAKLVPVVPVAHQVGVGDQHARRPLVGLKHADRLARLHQQRLVVLQPLEGGHDGVEGLPVARRLAGAAVDDQVLGTFGDLGVEVVHQHAHRGLLLPALAAQLCASRRAHDRARPTALMATSAFVHAFKAGAPDSARTPSIRP